MTDPQAQAPVTLDEAPEHAEESAATALVEDVSIDGMCGVY